MEIQQICSDSRATRTEKRNKAGFSLTVGEDEEVEDWEVQSRDGKDGWPDQHFSVRSFRELSGGERSKSRSSRNETR